MTPAAANRDQNAPQDLADNVDHRSRGESHGTAVIQRQKRVLFIGGSMNQTTQVHQVASQIPNIDAWFSPHYATGFEEWLRKMRLTEFTVIGKKHVTRCLEFCNFVYSSGVTHVFE